MTQGRAKKEKPMTEEAFYIGVDVAKSTLDLGSVIPQRLDNLKTIMRA
jgi:hypothetical protein